MGLIHIDLFTTLDLVAQAPGGPEEDPEGGFRFGGWQAPLFDDVVGEQITAGMQDMDALLLGRKTYDIFAGYWPHQEGKQNDDIATLFNRIPKYVASRSQPTLDWAGSTLLGPDIDTAVGELRERHGSVHVIGSVDLVQTLLERRLFDRLNLWVYPIVLGEGKRVFAGGAVPANLELVAPAVSSPSGAVHLRYALAPGTPATGDMAADVDASG
jgi:dihydrofolate reductase